MLVSELIEFLEEVDPDAEILLGDFYDSSKTYAVDEVEDGLLDEDTDEFTPSAELQRGTLGEPAVILRPK